MMMMMKITRRLKIISFSFLLKVVFSSEKNILLIIIIIIIMIFHLSYYLQRKCFPLSWLSAGQFFGILRFSLAEYWNFFIISDNIFFCYLVKCLIDFYSFWFASFFFINCQYESMINDPWVGRKRIHHHGYSMIIVSEW